MSVAPVISTSRPASAPRWRWWAAVARLPAEAFQRVRDSLEPVLRLGPSAAPSAVASGLARSLQLPRSDAKPPSWLRADQAGSFARILAGLARYRGSMLADPVGSGKTYVALAAASRINGAHPTLCVVPAVLMPQWRRVADRLGCPVRLHSHERLSRGARPPETVGLVIIDESHHFRNPSTRRYRELAPRLVGRPVLLLTATPVVNRFADLGAQLQLALRDDALLWHGVPSLGELLRLDQSHPALGELVIVGQDQAAEDRPEAVADVAHPPSELPPGVYTILDGLTLSEEPGIAALVRSVLWHAAASSPAALLGALRRYRALLLQARDALASGREWNRAALRSFTGSAPDQLVLWPVLDPGVATASTAVLTLDDLPGITEVIELLRPGLEAPDAKSRCLRDMLADQRRSLVFVTAQETVGYLRNHLDTPRVAWCTGSGSGIGAVRVPRASVLAHFGVGGKAEASGGWAPRCLVTTDVTAEGLDLQAAERVVHYDLPWTSVRLAQREGRALRLGSRHARVAIVRFAPPEEIERRLHAAYRLAFKARLPGRLGLDGREGGWGWRDRTARALGQATGVAGVGVLEDPEPGILAGFEIVVGAEKITVLEWRAPDGTWWESPALITDRLAAAQRACRGLQLEPPEAEQLLAFLRPWVRERLGRLTARRWADGALTSEARGLLRRLRALGASAARRRDAETLNRLDRALRFVAGGHTAGEEALVATLALLPDEDLLRGLPSLPTPRAQGAPCAPVLTGVIVFRAPS